MNTIVTSKEAILTCSRELVREKGILSLNIRAVADAADISVGSVYTYYQSKADLLCATVESIWLEIFRFPADCSFLHDVCQCIEWMYQCMEQGEKAYPGFIAQHAIGFAGSVKADGKQRMDQIMQHVIEQLAEIIRQDPKVKADVFHDGFTPEKISDLILHVILSSTQNRNFDPSVLTELLCRAIY